MDAFANAVYLISSRLAAMKNSLESQLRGPPPDFFATFDNSPALNVLKIVAEAFHRGDDGSILYPKMSLETLTHQGRSGEASDQRDTVYALLSLANDIVAPENHTIPIVPDCSKPLLDVYTDFMLHCVHGSGSLDIICRPWAPPLTLKPTGIQTPKTDLKKLRTLPSWFATCDKLPLGDPSRQSHHRLHGDSLIGSDTSPRCSCHYNTKASIKFGTIDDGGCCDGTIRVKGFVVCEVLKRSTRMANAIITKECLDILGSVLPARPEKLPDIFWRTLCADRDEDGNRAPQAFGLAMHHLLELSSEANTAEDAANLLENLSSVDIEELLDSNPPAHVRKFSEVVLGTVWNCRTFRSHPLPVFEGVEQALVGLIPQPSRLGDKVCILFACSVPVVLRQISGPIGSSSWQLIGEAYVHGIMDGEAIRFGWMSKLGAIETEFEIR